MNEFLIAVALIIFTSWFALKIFGPPVSFNMLTSFLSGEKVLFLKRWVWAVSGRLWPYYYRWSFSIPPVMEQGLYVTDRRVLLVGYMFRVLKFEGSLWFEGTGVPDNNNIVKEVNVRKSRIAGPYLEIVAESPVKRWFHSRQGTVHIFMRNPESVRKIIAEAMTRNSKDGQ
jgi:hypothetical protein